MLIFLRGLPGSGKTVISNSLGARMGYKVIHVDGFKKELMERNSKALFIKEVVPYSYRRTLEVLENSKRENLIVEEIFRNGEFVGKIIDFCKKNGVPYQWFTIVRNPKDVMETNDTRERKVKNTPESLATMAKQISDIKIEGEMLINNDGNLEECVGEIEGKVKGE